MTQRYVDASAVLRVLFAEPGVQVPLDSAGPLASSALVAVEASRAIDRGRVTAELGEPDITRKRQELEQLLARMNLVAVSAEALELARAPFPMSVRALDAVHIATAQLLAGEAGPLEFWTHDARQGAAAASRGLVVRGVALP